MLSRFLSFLLLALLVMVFPQVSPAQGRETVESIMKKGFEGRTLVLKTPYVEDKLHFDSQQHLIGVSEIGPWTTRAWIRVNQLELKDNRLRIEGNRTILVLDRQSSSSGFVPLLSGEKVQITFDLTASDQAAAAMLPVFDTQPVQSRMATYWTPILDLSKDLAVLRNESADRVAGVLEGNRQVFLGDASIGLQPPRAIKTPDPNYPPEARHNHLAGDDGLVVVINEQGFPEVLEVKKAGERFFDESALRAVSRWRFKPATKDGKAVAVVINVVVTFRYPN